ncbi:hypothetical protein [Bradyrhizobium arachidis]|uniref:hypothetical protein n=1 Tax=Bradyrhizobium arachidis TaxID=858423 RepID=UPI00142DB4EE|nr:hypothetical protein [Bradyrhizobium arachidis]
MKRKIADERLRLTDAAAVQYLTWALEEIHKLGQPKAAVHVRIALAELQENCT